MMLYGTYTDTQKNIHKLNERKNLGALEGKSPQGFSNAQNFRLI